ncbi:MAG: hypothetical protein DDT21_02647 [Syntrophomonadaceae bacterium]|nr:hypothetical protein [Bacillota bacterium]
MIIRDFFIYSTGRFSIAPGATVTQNIAIQADADFEILQLTYASDIAGGANTNNVFSVPNVSILLIDSGSGRQLSNIPIPLQGFFATARDPFIMPLVRRLSARSTLTVTITSFEAVNTNNLTLNFIGAKVFGG